MKVSVSFRVTSNTYSITFQQLFLYADDKLFKAWNIVLYNMLFFVGGGYSLTLEVNICKQIFALLLRGNLSEVGQLVGNLIHWHIVNVSLKLCMVHLQDN